MNLNITDPVDPFYILPHQICHISRTHGIQRQPHCKQTVCILSERLPVKEIAPAPQHLSVKKRKSYGIKDLKRGEMFNPRQDKGSDYCRDYSAVNGKSALPEIENIQQIVLVQIPGKNHEIKSGTDNPGNYAYNAHIKIVVRILPGPLCLGCRNQKTNQNSRSDNNPVIGHLKAKNTDRLSHVFQFNSKIGKADIIMHVFLLPSSVCSYKSDTVNCLRQLLIH